MQGFPPEIEGQVTLANWRTAPFNAWAFQHVRELIPSADIANSPDDTWSLPDAPYPFESLRIGTNGAALSLDEFLVRSHTDGLIVLHQGGVVYETYRGGWARAARTS